MTATATLTKEYTFHDILHDQIAKYLNSFKNFNGKDVKSQDLFEDDPEMFP